MANFNINLDLDTFHSRKKHISRIGEIIEKAFNDGIEEFSDRLLDKLVSNLGKYGLNNSRMSMEIDVKKTDDGVSIIVDSEYALFVEYGTGIVGKSNPHPNPSIHGWRYDVNEHGEKGWFYPTVESDPNPYKHHYNGQLYGWTKGLPSRPFMYETWLWGSRSASSIINKHINRALKELESDFK